MAKYYTQNTKLNAKEVFRWAKKTYTQKNKIYKENRRHVLNSKKWDTFRLSFKTRRQQLHTMFPFSQHNICNRFTQFDCLCKCFYHMYFGETSLAPETWSLLQCLKWALCIRWLPFHLVQSSVWVFGNFNCISLISPDYSPLFPHGIFASNLYFDDRNVIRVPLDCVCLRCHLML